MADRPILFSAPMIAAILDGRKTQTRRILKPQPFIDKKGNFCCEDSKGKFWNYGQHLDGYPCTRNFIDKELRIKVSDRLWVREAWGVGSRPCPVDGWRDGIEYRADGHGLDEAGPLPLYSECVPDGIDLSVFRNGWRPSIHMPRWASRITLLVTDVRVQRLQDISEEDAIAEGIDRALEPADYYGRQRVRFCSLTGDNFVWRHSAIAAYRDLWEFLHGPGSWDENPFVAAYSFDPIFQNIDSIGASNGQL